MYRSVSANAAFLVARTPPLRFLAPMRKRIYEGMKRLREEDEFTKKKKMEIKKNEHADMCEMASTSEEAEHSGGVHKDGHSAKTGGLDGS